MTKLNGPVMLLSTLVCAGAIALSASASAEEKTTFEMASYSNSPGGKEIAAGDYTGAIARASRGLWRFDATTALVASTNLCVAHTVKRDLAEAESACAKAVTLAKRADATPSTRFPRAIATSKAMMNRGVLRALRGDSIGAANDFREAAAMRGADPAASRNLAYLQSSPTHRLALVGAASE